MPMNRVQFERGLPMHEFMALYGTESPCEEALIQWRWPEGHVCPGCGLAGGAFSSHRRGGLLLRQCSACHHQCSLIAGTLFEATKLPLTTWFLAMHLMAQAKNNLSALSLSRQLGVSYPSAWLIKHKLLEAMRLREDDRQLSGRVEIDDAYLGGRRAGGKAGRGSENKVPFVAAVQTTESGEAQFVCLAAVPFTKKAISDFLNAHLVRPLTVVSDGLSCFTVAVNSGVHDRVIVSEGKEAAYAKFQAISVVQSNLKTALRGTYHAIDFAKYAHRYLAEFQYRFNRRFNLRAIFERLARLAVRTKPLNEATLRAAEVGC